MSTLETTVTVEATLPPSGTKPPLRKTGPTNPGSGEIDGESFPNIAGKLDNFSILRKLGSGAMGVVYAAYDEHLGRRVAIKLLRSQLARQTSRFLREAQGLARLSHPNVVQVYQVGTHDGRVFIAMEFVGGRTLRTWLEHGPHSRAEILRVFMDAATGLAAAHAANLVHRDFKPDNVMVGDDGHVKVMDFGLVQENGNDLEELVSSHGSGSEEVMLATRRLDSALNLELTQPGSLLGTPAYMAPEQHLGQPTDARADQFAFCVSLWEALYGKRPFTGETWQELIDNVTGYNLVEPPRSHDVPNWLRAVVERGLQTDPDHRWPSMVELIDALGADPTRRRRWLIASGVALVAAMSGTLGYRAHAQNQREAEAALALAQERERDEQCTSEGDEIQTAWNDDIRASVQKAMLGVEHPTSEGALRRTEALFDDYAAAWARTRKDVCIKAEVEPERADWAALARVCLDQRHHELATLAALFTELDEPGEIIQSVQSAASLAAVEDCIDEDLLDRNISIPAPEISARVDGIHRHLSEVRANLAMGRYKDALHKAEVAVEAAKGIDWAPVLAVTAYWRGQALLDNGQREAGRADLENALFVAGQIDDPIAVWAAGHLVFSAAMHSEYDAAARWGRVGELLTVQTDSEMTLAHAKLLIDIGTLHGRQNNHVRAIASFERALDIYLERLPADHPEIAKVYNNLGVAQLDAKRYTEALDYHHRALDLRRQTLPPNHPDIGYSHYGVGRVYAEQGEYGPAIDAFILARDIWMIALGVDSPLVAYALTELGEVYRHDSQYGLAQAALEKALDIREATAEAIPVVELAKTRFALAQVLWAAKQDHARALELAEAAREGFTLNERLQGEVVVWLEARAMTEPGAGRAPSPQD